MSEDKLIDWQVALKTAQGKEEFLKELVQLFLDESAKMFDELRAALDEKNAKTIQRTAHTLKSSLKALGAMPVAQLAERLETIGRENRLDDADEAAALLREKFEQLKPELIAFVDCNKTVA